MNRSDKIPVSVVVPVKNEGKTLGRCLDRLSRFSEILVVDSGSTDNTVEVAQQRGIEVVSFEWDGKYPKKRNWMLMNHRFRYDWVFFLDADELVTEEFCDELSSAVDEKRYAGYWISYINFFQGRPLRFGDAQRKLALFRVGSGLYEQIEEENWSHLDMEVHEHPIINGEVGSLAARILHQDDRGILHWIDRHKAYASWEAKRSVELFNSRRSSGKELTRRQKLKYRNIGRWWFPWTYFLFCYVYKLGFLDGKPGFSIAFYKAWYFHTIYLLIQEKGLAPIRTQDNRL